MGKATWSAASLFWLCAMALASGDCWAQANDFLPPLRLKKSQEIAPFRLTAIQGYVMARFLRDANRDTGLPGGVDGSAFGPAGSRGSRASQSNMVYEIGLMTHSYIYHPSLLSLDLGGGPVIDKGIYDANGMATNARRQMFNFNGRATVLRDKPYTGALFYQRQNENQSIGPAQEMLTDNTRYGASFSLLNPVTRFPLQVELSRAENQGKGAEQVIEDRIDQLSLKMEANLGRLGWMPYKGMQGMSRLEYVATRQDSASGSVGLPVQASSSSNDSLSLDSNLKFGAANEYDLNNSVKLRTNNYSGDQGSLAALRNFDFGLTLLGRHSDDLQTNGRYTFSNGQQNEQSTTTNSVSGGISYRLTPDLSSSLGARVDSNKSSQISSSLYGLDGTAQYRQTLPLGIATLGYSFAYNQRDQQATTLEAKAIGEHVALVGTSLSLLGSEQIVAGSVVVSNLTRTQTFLEGSDYLLSPIGLKLRMQRVIGGNILDGQEVLVDYAYATGGSYALSQLDNTVSLSWALKNYLNVFLRHMVSTPQLKSGAPTAPLNPATSTLFGAHAELPLSLLSEEVLVGGNVEREDRREIILPFKRLSADAYAQVDLPWVRSGNLRLTRRRLHLDYDLSPTLGVKLDAYDLRLGARIKYGVTLSAEASREHDSGTPLARERSSASVRALWNMRKLKANFNLARVRDVQGAAEKSRTHGQFTLRRDF